MAMLDPKLWTVAEDYAGAVKACLSKLGRLAKLDAARAAPFMGAVNLLRKIDHDRAVREPLAYAKELAELATAARAITAQLDAALDEVN